MVLINKLRGKMVERGYTIKKLAKELDISERTLQNHFKSGIFNNVEMEKMTEILLIENPSEIFFAKKST